MKRSFLTFCIAISASITLMGDRAHADAPVDFGTQIIPVLTKAGCNAGSCHGAALGRGGFKLSLWGSNAAVDYQTMVHELEGRRVNLSRPDKSLVLLKPTIAVHHEGGRRLSSKGPGAKLILDWLAAGAPPPANRRLRQLSINPQQAVLDKVGQSVRLKISAAFDKGALQDVTAWTVFSPTDPAAVEVDKTGKATVLRPGQHTVIIRYLDQVKAVRLSVPLTDKAITVSAEARRNFIDDQVLETLKTLRLPLSAQTNDAAFLRRVSLDLTGTLPRPDDVLAFVRDPSKGKRARLIDKLLKSSAFIDYWTYRWANLLQINSKRLQDGGRVFHDWLKEQVTANTPLDAMSRQMLTTIGDSYQKGAANFSRVPGNAREQAEYVSRVFMGVRLRCANCHDHPLDMWKQDDYHGMAAMFARVQRGRVVSIRKFGDVTHPRTGKPAVPRIPATRFLDSGEDGRAALAKWLTAPDNRYFAKAAVNRMWQAMMGRGLVEPVDDLRATNPATHPALLDELAADFIEHKFDMRHTLRTIANSAAYQRASTSVNGNEGDDQFYSRARIRALPAEVIADAIAQVTGVPDQYGNQPVGTRAIILWDAQIPAPALDILGRCSRQAVCETTPAGSGGMAQMLHLINGKLINRKVASAQGTLHQLLKSKKTDEQIIQQLYLLTLGRKSSAAEISHWTKQIAEAESVANEDFPRKSVLEDLFWALISSRQFMSNR